MGDVGQVLLKERGRFGRMAPYVTDSTGLWIDMTDYPLEYADELVPIEPKLRAPIADFERRRRANKIEYALLVDAEGNVLDEHRGGKHSVRISLQHISHAVAHVHTHPRFETPLLIGGTFTWSDLSILYHWDNLKVIRAVASEGIYTLMCGSDFDRKAFDDRMGLTYGKIERKELQKLRDLHRRLELRIISRRDYRKEWRKIFLWAMVSHHNALLEGQQGFDYVYQLEQW